MYQRTTLPLHAPPSEVVAGHGARQRNLTLEDISSDPISKIAKKHYGGSKPKWDPSIIETIVEKELNNFDSRKVMLLEYTQYLEKVRDLLLMAIFCIELTSVKSTCGPFSTRITLL